MNPEMVGDIYLSDGAHYLLSVEEKVLVTTVLEHHIKNGGEWWWKGREPEGLPIDEFYYTDNVVKNIEQNYFPGPTKL